MPDIQNSKAGTGKQYLSARVRVYDTCLHFQVKCQKINRDYGYVFETPKNGGETQLTTLKLMGVQTVPSLANSGTEYIPVQVRPRNGKLHLQAAGPEVNRPHGLSLDLDATPSDLERIGDLIG